MFKFILLCFCINFAFSSPVIQFFIEEEIKLEQPQPILIKTLPKIKIYLKFFLKTHMITTI